MAMAENPRDPSKWPKCALFPLGRQFATLYLFHAPTGGGEKISQSTPQKVVLDCAACSTPPPTGVIALFFWRRAECGFGEYGFAHQTHENPTDPCIAILLESIAIHLPFLSRHFGKSIALLLAESTMCTANLYHDTPPICIAILFRKYEGQGSLEHS